MAELNVFIDTNIWLSFYAFTNDDLEQLRKLIALIKNGKLKLYINQQVSDEFYRNREAKLQESIKDFSKSSLIKGMPRYMRDYPDAAKYSDAIKNVEKLRDILVTRAIEEARSKELAADKLFADIIKASQPVVPIAPDIISKALNRRLKGNPPGKNTSLGDQIHWEYLLQVVPNTTDLHLVSKDGDFESALGEGRVHPFVQDEWANKKKAALTLHTELRPFLNSTFPDIKLAVDVEKNDAMERLLNTRSFATTHLAVEGLALFVNDLSWLEADKILTIGIENSQISWIGTDSDVSDFYKILINKFADKIDAERGELLNQIFDKSIVDDPDTDVDFNSDPPF
jgi:predicted nucleic acid-binding protein